MKANFGIYLIAASLAASCLHGQDRDPGQRLQEYLAYPDSRGSVFAQGTMDGVDYRKLLRGAIHKDRTSLVRLFQYTAHGQLMGEGYDSNADILRQLLRLWGDGAYSKVLAAQAPDVRSSVIGSLDYVWPGGWQSTSYPKTFKLAEHDKSVGG